MTSPPLLPVSCSLSWVVIAPLGDHIHYKLQNTTGEGIMVRSFDLVFMQEPKFGMLMAPLKSPLTQVEDDLRSAALELFNMVDILFNNQTEKM